MAKNGYKLLLLHVLHLKRILSRSLFMALELSESAANLNI